MREGGREAEAVLPSNKEEMETELHFLTKCEKYEQIREHFLPKFTRESERGCAPNRIPAHLTV